MTGVNSSHNCCLIVYWSFDPRSPQLMNNFRCFSICWIGFRGASGLVGLLLWKQSRLTTVLRNRIWMFLSKLSILPSACLLDSQIPLLQFCFGEISREENCGEKRFESQNLEQNWYGFCEYCAVYSFLGWRSEIAIICLYLPLRFGLPPLCIKKWLAWPPNHALGEDRSWPL